MQVVAQEKIGNAPASDYQQVIHQRSYKIVTPTGIADSAKFYRVEAIVANQYLQLGQIHDSANAQIKIAKTNPYKRINPRYSLTILTQYYHYHL
jgi:hypothetical protein